MRNFLQKHNSFGVCNPMLFETESRVEKAGITHDNKIVLSLFVDLKKSTR